MSRQRVVAPNPPHVPIICFVARECSRSGARLADDAPGVLGAQIVKRSIEFAGNRRLRRQPARKRANIRQDGLN